LKSLKIWAMVGLSAVLLGAMSCKKQAPEQGQEPPVIHSIRFEPGTAVSGKELKAVPDYATLKPNQKVYLSCKWYRDGELLKDYTTDTLPGSEVRAGAEIEVEVTAACCENLKSVLRSDKLKVGEAEFQFLKIFIAPMMPNKDDTLAAQYECQNCAGVKMHYRWYLNDQEVKNFDLAELPGPEHELKPGDMVSVELSPEPLYPRSFFQALPVKIMARLPQELPGSKIWLENGVVYFQFRARDPEAGPISYELVSAPPGAILSQQGQVSWNLPQGFTGPVEFRVKAKTSFGRETVIGAKTSVSQP